MVNRAVFPSRLAPTAVELLFTVAVSMLLETPLLLTLVVALREIVLPLAVMLACVPLVPLGAFSVFFSDPCFSVFFCPPVRFFETIAITTTHSTRAATEIPMMGMSAPLPLDLAPTQGNSQSSSVFGAAVTSVVVVTFGLPVLVGPTVVFVPLVVLLSGSVDVDGSPAAVTPVVGLELGVVGAVG